MISEKINSIIDKYYSAIHLIKENISCYCVDPASDFTRSREITPDILIDYLVQLQSKSCRSEIADYFVHYDDIPSDSALCQQRAKLLPSALERVFQLFNSSYAPSKTWQGFYILAFDGSDVNIPRDLDDEETLIQNGTNKSFNQYHLKALYDVLNERYWDIDLRTATKNRRM